MRHPLVACALLVLLAASGVCRGQPLVIDAFDSAQGWTVMPSDGVKASVSLVEGVDGEALRLHYNFEAGAGFVVLRREAPQELRTGIGEHYRFTFHLRGIGPRNNLEFKLVDPTGDNVWWLNQRAYEWPAAWKQERLPERKISFAWGPVGAKAPNPRPDSLGFIEFAIAASEGGSGTVDFDSLTFERLSPPAPVIHTPTVTRLSATEHEIDFKQEREFGGLMLEWDESAFPSEYTVLTSIDGRAFTPILEVKGARGGRRFIQLPDAQAQSVRLSHQPHTETAPALRSAEVLSVEFGSSDNAMFREIARRERRGTLPRYFSGEQSYWTVVGTPSDRDEALLSADGAIELGTSGITVEPFLTVGKSLLTWAEATTTHQLRQGYLPIPRVEWNAGDLKLSVECFADGATNSTTVVSRYRVTNSGPQVISGSLVLAIRPFQVLPPWQELNITGGVSRIDSISYADGWVHINGRPRVRALTAPTGFGAAPLAAGEAAEWWAKGEGPKEQAVMDPMRLASGSLHFDFTLEHGQSTVVDIEALLRPNAEPPSPAKLSVADRLNACEAMWVESLNKVQLSLPPSAKGLADTFRSTQAYILINQDGPAIQPGSRTYERSWMRDGSLTGATLLYTGHPREMQNFVEWYARYQYPDGKVPCVVDRRGPDPVPEHDSHGQLIYAIWTTYAFTRDREFLERMWPRIDAAVGYIDSLRRQRMTDEYRDPASERHAMFGLVPESISHEGYSAKPMHSYWDSFFVVKGLKDAVAAARELGRTEDASRIEVILQEYRGALVASISRAMADRGVEYIPGCVELGDFDATSTAIGLYPCGELSSLPARAVAHTFDRYFKFFEDRRDGRIEWKDYTPYEIRLVSTFVRLGQLERAHALLDYFFQDQRPAGWNHWAEVVWREAGMPRFIGDMPHTWVGSEFLQAARTLVVYENGEGLVIGAGLRPGWAWEGDGVSAGDFPTEHGTLKCSWRGEGGTLRVEIGPGLERGPRRHFVAVPMEATGAGSGGEPLLIELLEANSALRGVWWDGKEGVIEVTVPGR